MEFESGPRETILLKYDWKFSRDDSPDAADPGFDDAGWQTVRVPHDWAIAGPFDRDNDLQHLSIMEDGEKKTRDHVARTGGLPIVGVGWYRLAFGVPADWEGRRIVIEFDGVMSHSEVFVNGRRVGGWPFGYASFRFDITGHVDVAADNLLAVRCDPKPCASRWYPGAGIYRHVRLVSTAPLHVRHDGLRVVAKALDGDTAELEIRSEILNEGPGAPEPEIVTEILDPDGRVVGTDMVLRKIDGEDTVHAAVKIRNVQRWDIDAPRLYRAVTSLVIDEDVVDRAETTFGVRETRFDASEGFFLNGRHLKLNGVCMHHDLGALGAAVNRRALQRQVETLREMGCNAIRTSHNPPAPELLDLCDRMGMLVIDEAFDEWKEGKVDNGYHTLFDEWAEKDLVAFIRRDANHPCVIMWSIGNEIREQASPEGAEIARFLTDICHREDPTRPVTAGFNNSEGAIANGLAEVVDVPGWNYKPHEYARYHREHPEWIAYGSETASCVSSRGEYYFPVQEEKMVTRETLLIPSYDLATPRWGCAPDIEFKAQDECPSILGEFVWTGFDYLGEPTPYYSEWPSRSSYFGIVDLAGFPKDRFYSYRSQWTDKPVLHLFPHWNWEGREGEVTPVHCYTGFDAAELFLNGASQGVRRKEGDDPYTRHRLVWNEVRYEPGELKVVALDADGRPAMETTVATAGAPARIQLVPDRKAIAADGDDLCFVTVRVVDKDGRLCPRANHDIRFETEGPIELAGTDNGDQSSLESFQAPRRKAFNGLCLAILRSLQGRAGVVRLHARAEGLENGEARFKTLA